MVSKKKRRRQLARVAAQRQTERRALRAERKRRLMIGAWAAVAVLAIGGLSAWIATHETAPTVTPVQNPLAQLGLATANPTYSYSPSPLPSTSTPSLSTPSPSTTSPTTKPTAKESK